MNDADRSEPSRRLKLLRGAGACALLAAVYAVIFANLREVGLAQVTFTLSVTGTYLVLAYTVRPKTGPKALGWFGGLLEHPYSISNDLQRCLMILAVVLWPGRLLAEALVELPLLRARR